MTTVCTYCVSCAAAISRSSIHGGGRSAAADEKLGGGGRGYIGRTVQLGSRRVWVVLRRGRDEAVLVGVGGRRGARGEAELGKNVAHVPRNRLLADHEIGGDAAVCLAGREQPQDLALAVREAADCARVGLP